MSTGTAFQAGGKNHLDGYNPYWRAYWTKKRGPHSLMVGTFGMQAKVYPDSASPSGPSDVFTDYGFDSQYQYLADTHKVTLRGSYIYEHQKWNASFPLAASSTATGNLKSLNLNGSYGYPDHWVFNAAYFLTNGNNNTALCAMTDPSGNTLTSSPNTSGYVLEVDRLITQNLQATIQYKGFVRFNGLANNIDGLGRNANANNTLWLTVFRILISELHKSALILIGASLILCTMALAQKRWDAPRVVTWDCSGCHGIDGNAQLPYIARLAGLNSAYIEQRIAEFEASSVPAR